MASGPVVGLRQVFPRASQGHPGIAHGAFPETQQILEILREAHSAPSPGWSEVVSFEAFIQGLLKWRESTSTSPSGRHLGLYKTLLTVYIDSGSKFCKKPTADHLSSKEKAERILRMIHGLVATATCKGFYLRRWRRVIT